MKKKNKKKGKPKTKKEEYEAIFYMGIIFVALCPVFMTITARPMAVCRWGTSAQQHTAR